MKILIKLVTTSVLLMFSALSWSASITPATFSATIGVGETVSVDKTITLDAAGPAVSKVDVFFLADNTGSMGGIISSVKANASAVLSAISGGDSRFAGIDVGFGVGRYRCDPVESCGTPTTAYTLQQSIVSGASSATAAQTAINGWFASGGGDGPEANFYALQQVATEGAATASGAASGMVTDWRDGAGKVVVWFGDARSHTATIGQAETIAALQAAGVTVVAINTRTAGSGIDTFGQASAITSATGGTLTNGVTGGSATQTINAILDAVETATSTIDLAFTAMGDTSGLDVSYTCTDAAGCMDVGAGESRTFRMDVTGLTEGTYVYDTIAVGVKGAVEVDTITVGKGSTAVPEPSTLGLLGLGLFAVGAVRRRSTK